MNAPLHIDRPWLRLDLGGPKRVLSWAVHRPGPVAASAITWREVRNADLTEDFDVTPWLTDELSRKGWQDDVCFLTSRDVRSVTEASVTVETVSARAVATVGLSNAEAIGTRLPGSGQDWGTINIAVVTDAPLSAPALIEALSIAAAARTAAVLDAALDLPTGRATGTGTDCIAVAAPEGAGAYAGMHTALGEAVGRAVSEAVGAGVRDWMQNVRRTG